MSNYMQKAYRFFTVVIFLLASRTPTVYGFDWPELLLYQKNGAAAADQFGYTVAGAGDVNGDGRSDFIVGAPFADPGGLANAGSAFVYSGATGLLLYQKNGPTAGDQFGQSVAGAGDVDGDGKADFIVGAPFADPGGVGFAGSAFVYSGATGALLFQKNGAAAFDLFGFSVGGVGDATGDNRSEFIVGAHFADPGGLLDAGSAYVYSGATGTLLYQKDGAEGDQFGVSVAGAGDANGDNRADFIIGARLADPTLGLIDAGSAFVYSGATGALLYRKDGAVTGDELGWPVSGAGDVDGDGRGDFLISARLADPGAVVNAGSVFIYSGATGTLLYQKDGAAVEDRFGFWAAGAGDVNGDGKAEFIVGAFKADPGGLADAGSVFIYSGATGGLLFQRNGAAGDSLGFSVAGAGDVNGDGRAEVIVGAPFADPGALSAAGSAFVYALRSVRIASLADVPNDQGKQVIFRWKSFPGNDSLMDLFIVYRRLDSTFNSPGKGVLAADALPLPPGDWLQVAVLAATGDTAYATIVPTLVDSTLAGTKYSVFFVRGRSTNPLLSIDSPLDSGYSIDNLVPAPPANLSASGTPGGIVLAWRPVPDFDFDFFFLYRDTVAGFTLSPANRIKATSDTGAVDSPADASKTYYYRVTAVDFSGNEGPPSNEGTAVCAGVRGDVTDDAVADIVDIVALIQEIVFGTPLTNPHAGDTNCDDVRDIVDIVLLIQFVVFGSPTPCCL